MSQEFEGQEISEYIAQLPGMKLEAPESYQRGTYLTLSVEVRVRSVRYEEITSGKRKGDLQKVHMLAIENVTVEETITPAQHKALLERIAAFEDAGSSSEPVATVLSASVEPIDQMTPDTLTATAEPDDWTYADPEYVVNQAAAEVSAGF